MDEDVRQDRVVDFAIRCVSQAIANGTPPTRGDMTDQEFATALDFIEKIFDILAESDGDGICATDAELALARQTITVNLRKSS